MRSAPLIAALLALGACASETTAEPEITRPAGDGVLPAVQADGCPTVDPAELTAIEAALDPGLRLATATAQTAPDGVRYVVASIYDETAYRVSSADTWATIDGALYTVSASAVEYSNAAERRDLISTPTAEELETCAIAAL